ncbi:hypothetical protein TIFTF001_016504 [Ficus carica]|uniref:Uncharacterized protein n=1 Tax=Ficus carica TaxID=3494 RepID=A0AA88AJP1_FICCA|nr:hypothetical protein TIFTF001_016504 [Ficus carica]
MEAPLFTSYKWMKPIVYWKTLLIMTIGVESFNEQPRETRLRIEKLENHHEEPPPREETWKLIDDDSSKEEETQDLYPMWLAPSPPSLAPFLQAHQAPTPEPSRVERTSLLHPYLAKLEGVQNQDPFDVL